MKDIAILVDNLKISQKNYYMVKSMNTIRKDNNIVAFYHNLSTQVVRPHFSTMNISRAQYWTDGVIISTSFKTLESMKSIVTRAKKYHYMWDLEWLYESYNYMENMNLLEDVDIICRSEEHYGMILKYCNKKSLIIPKWNREKILNL